MPWWGMLHLSYVIRRRYRSSLSVPRAYTALLTSLLTGVAHCVAHWRCSLRCSLALLIHTAIATRNRPNQDMQECGQPPAEIIKELAPGLQFGPDGMPLMANMGAGVPMPPIPGMPGGMMGADGQPNCLVM